MPTAESLCALIAATGGIVAMWRVLRAVPRATTRASTPSNDLEQLMLVRALEQIDGRLCERYSDLADRCRALEWAREQEQLAEAHGADALRMWNANVVEATEAYHAAEQAMVATFAERAVVQVFSSLERLLRAMPQPMSLGGLFAATDGAMRVAATDADAVRAIETVEAMRTSLAYPADVRRDWTWTPGPGRSPQSVYWDARRQAVEDVIELIAKLRSALSMAAATAFQHRMRRQQMPVPVPDLSCYADLHVDIAHWIADLAELARVGFAAPTDPSTSAPEALGAYQAMRVAQSEIERSLGA